MNKKMLKELQEVAKNKTQNINVYEVYRGQKLFAFVLFNLGDVLENSLLLRLLQLQYFNTTTSAKSIPNVLKQDKTPVYMLNCDRCEFCGTVQHACGVFCTECSVQGREKVIMKDNSQILQFIEACETIEEGVKAESIQ
jgi:hypothetical protein